VAHLSRIQRAVGWSPRLGSMIANAWSLYNQRLVVRKPTLGCEKTNAWLRENQGLVARKPTCGHKLELQFVDFRWLLLVLLILRVNFNYLDSFPTNEYLLYFILRCCYDFVSLHINNTKY